MEGGSAWGLILGCTAILRLPCWWGARAMGSMMMKHHKPPFSILGPPRPPNTLPPPPPPPPQNSSVWPELAENTCLPQNFNDKRHTVGGY